MKFSFVSETDCYHRADRRRAADAEPSAKCPRKAVEVAAAETANSSESGFTDLRT